MRMEDIHRQARELRERLEGSDDGQKRNVLHKFLSQIPVDPKAKEILVKVKSTLSSVEDADIQFGHTVGSPEGICMPDQMYKLRWMNRI